MENKKKILKFDIMVGERFVATERMPITLDMIKGYDGDIPIIDINKINEYVLSRRPTLRHEDFKICF